MADDQTGPIKRLTKLYSNRKGPGEPDYYFPLGGENVEATEPPPRLYVQGRETQQLGRVEVSTTAQTQLMTTVNPKHKTDVIEDEAVEKLRQRMQELSSTRPMPILATRQMPAATAPLPTIALAATVPVRHSSDTRKIRRANIWFTQAQWCVLWAAMIMAAIALGGLLRRVAH